MEFVANDKDLMFFPERSFTFCNSGEFLMIQDQTFIGGFIWDAEVVLAHYVDSIFYRSLSTWSTISVLEIGCGCGLASLVCSRLGARIVTASDKLDIIHLVEQCSRQNHVEIRTKSFLWGSLENDISSEWEQFGYPFDVILAADILYHEADFDNLKKTFDVLTKPGSIVLIAYEERRRDLNSAWQLFYSDYDILDLSSSNELCRYYKDSIHINIHQLTKR